MPAPGPRASISAAPLPGDGLDAQVEIDWYGGIKPTWNSPLGTIEPRLRRHLLLLPGRHGLPRPNVDYVEFKAGYSWSALHPSLVTGTTVYYSPDYTFETGPVWTIETMAAWTLPQFHVFTPVINGVLGWQKGDSDEGYFVNVNGTDDEYYYWNAGLALTVEKSTFDFRYWDTNIGGDAGGHLRRAELLRRALRVLRQGRAALSSVGASTTDFKGDAHRASPF